MAEIDLDIPIDQMPIACACFNVRRASRVLSQIYDEAIAPAGIRGTQFTLLLAVHLAGDTGLSAMAGGLAMDRTTLSRNINKLVQRELVEDVAGDDSRTRRVRLTRQGKRVLNKALPLWRAVQEQLEAAIGTHRFDALRKLSREVVELAPGT